MHSKRRVDMLFVGYTKDSMKLVLHYRAKERYEKSPGTAAIVNAKFQSVSSRRDYIVHSRHVTYMYV